MASLKIQVDGLQEIGQRLKNMGKKSKPLMRKTLRNGAKIFAKTAKSKAPSKTGNLKRNIKVRAGRRSRRWTSYIVIMGSEIKEGGNQPGSATYATKIEFGAPHKGQAPNPVMRPTFDEQGNQVVNQIEEQLLNGLLAFEVPPPSEVDS